MKSISSSSPRGRAPGCSEGSRPPFRSFAEIDPVITGSIDLLARLSVNQINQEVLTAVVEQARIELSQTEGPLADALAEAPDADASLLVNPSRWRPAR